jgi:hypothetical protein
MPIEIRELVIKATVNKGTRISTNEGLSPYEIRKLKKEIIEECMDKLKSLVDDQFSR